MEDEAEVLVSIREDGETLPLIIRPKQGNDSVVFLQAWMARNISWLEQKLLDHGTLNRLWLYTTLPRNVYISVSKRAHTRLTS